MMLRPAIRARIEEMLQSDPFFSGHDFSLSILSEDSEQEPVTKVKIQYLVAPQFFLNATLLRDKERINGTLEYCFECEISPGEFGYEQIIKATTLNGLRSVIATWLARMREDIVLWPGNRILEEQQRQIERVVNKYQALQERYFSPEQVAQWQQRLTAIENRLSPLIAALEPADQEGSKHTAQLHSEIAALAIKLEAFDSPSWFRSFMGWFFKFAKTVAGQQLLRAGVAAALTELTAGQIALDPLPPVVAPTAAG